MATHASEAATGHVTPGAHRPSAGRYLLPLATGIVLLVAQVAFCFFARAIFLGFEIVAFALASAAFAYRRGRPWWLAAVLVAGPAFLYTAFIVGVALGPEKLAKGIGSSWLISLGLVPMSAIVGAYVGGRMGGQGRH
jgi:hypothetical protein